MYQLSELHHTRAALRDQFCAFRVEASVTTTATAVGRPPVDLFGSIASEALFGLAEIAAKDDATLVIPCMKLSYDDWIAQLLHAMHAAETHGLHPFLAVYGASARRAAS